MLHRADAVPDVAVEVWELLSIKLAAIVGDGGFQSLYARSIHLTRASFPWLAEDDTSHPSNSRFAALKVSLEGHESAEASTANIALLVIFVETLTVLIGDSLTMRILHSAWGDDVQNKDEKELQ